MSTGTQSTFCMLSVPSPLSLDPILLDETSNIPQLVKNSKPIHVQVQIPQPVYTEPTTYPESAYQWVTEVLEVLIDFGKRHGHYGVIRLTKEEYQWLDNVLEELICSVGEDENHPLAPLMDFIIRLIANYEQNYVPKLTELFPELAEEASIETASKSTQQDSNIPKQSDSELAAHAFFSMGHLLYHGNRTEKAISAYDKATALKPDFWEASYNCGIARYDLKQHTEAIIDFNTVVKLNQNFASTYYNRGILKSELKNYEGAIADFNEAIKLNPKHTNAYYNRGFTSYQLENFQAAINNFDTAIALGINSAEVYLNRANAKAHSGQYDNALVDYNEAIRINPDYAMAYYNRGIQKVLCEEFHAAITDFNEAIRIAPDYTEAYANRGMAKIGLDHIDEAKSDLQTAMELAEHKGNKDLKTFAEVKLQQLNDSTSQTDKTTLT